MKDDIQNYIIIFFNCLHFAFGKMNLCHLLTPTSPAAKAFDFYKGPQKSKPWSSMPFGNEYRRTVMNFFNGKLFKKENNFSLKYCKLIMFLNSVYNTYCFNLGEICF